MNKKWIWLPLMAAVLAGCSRENTAQPLHSVMTVQAGGASLTDQKQFSGVVKEQAEISLGFKTAGQIEKIYVHEGDHISEGQLLAVLDSKDYQLGVDAAEAQYNQMKDEVARMKKLLDGRSITANDYEKAASGLEQVAVQLQSNRNKVAYTQLKAPVSGIVQSVNFERAEMVNAGTPVFTILSSGQMKVEVSVPRELYETRNKIQHVTCTAGDQQVPVRLVCIIPKADASQLYKAVLNVTGNTAGLTPGMSVSVNFEQASGLTHGDVTLPESAVFQDGGKTYVWVVNRDSVVNRREVQTAGLDSEGRMVIKGGLSGQEQVVRAGVHALTDGEKVKVLPQQSKTNVGGLL